MVKPPLLQPGDTIAAVSPSWGGPGLFPAIYERGLRNLKTVFGLRIRELESARRDPDELYRNPKLRADDLNRAFADPDVKAIIASIGGDDSVRILQYLDTDLIRANPKILMGYSDATTYLTTIHQLGLVTFHGPSIMAGLAQLEALPPAFTQHIRDLLMTPVASYDYRPYGLYSEGYPDWSHAETIGQVNPVQPDPAGWVWVQGADTTVDGLLYGGCIEVLEFVKQTPFWPEDSFWEDRILFLEISEESPPPVWVKYWLRNYGIQGIFERVKAILVGRPRGYTPEQKQGLAQILQDVVGVEFGRPDLPIVANMDFGHTDPQWILPLGVRAQLNGPQRTFRLIERCTSGGS
ncbi:MAG: LD-carboxypeptidase [Anaerolineae bacterium]|nr:LD-carboxypeptidase [Anaerolineae bacterium]